MTKVYLEEGQKRIFAVTLDWPGWARNAKDEERALAVLSAYAPRYAPVAVLAGLEFELGAFDVVTKVPGDATTDFGAPSQVLDIDRRPIFADEAERQAVLYEACWKYFEQVIAAAPLELRKGPRGGGRNRDKMLAHVLDAESSYVRWVGLKSSSTRNERAAALRRPGPAVAKGEKGRRPSRYMARRMCWHIVDHAWEMEDRIEA